MDLLIVAAGGESCAQIESLFQEDDYTVFTIADREEALKLSSIVQLIIIDPDDLSEDMVQKLMQDLVGIKSKVPIMILSHKDGWNVKAAAFDAGVDDYITKPFSEDELLIRARSLIRRGQ